MDNIELILADLGEESTKRLVKKNKPNGLNENIELAKKGGNVAKVARNELERELGNKIVSDSNFLIYKYKNNKNEIK